VLLLPVTAARPFNPRNIHVNGSYAPIYCTDILLPVGVGCGLLQVWTTAAVNRIVVGIPEHSPHDRIQPRVEEERQKPDMADWNLVTTFSTQTHTTNCHDAREKNLISPHPRIKPYSQRCSGSRTVKWVNTTQAELHDNNDASAKVTTQYGRR